MKRTFRDISFFLLTLVMLLSPRVTAFAADSTITFNGTEEGFDIQPGSEYTATDLFDNFKDVMPGDTLTENITITNKAKDSDYIKLYMRALVHDENGNPLTYNENFENTDGKDQTSIAGQRDETAVTMADFLAQLSMKVYNGEALIYNASPDELDGFAENVLLGTFRYGESANLTVELAVPIELGNEYANRVGEVDWIFVVEALQNPVPTPTPTPSPSPEATPNPSPSPSPTPVPSAPNEPDESPETPEEESQPEVTPTPVPEVVTPSTGDNLHLGLYIILMLACIVVILVMKKLTAKHKGEK